MATAKIIIFKSKTHQSEKHPVTLIITKDGKRKHISPGYYAKETQWNARLPLVLQFGYSTKADQLVFLFNIHYINDDLPTIEHTGIQSLADYTGIGYLDMTVGSKDHGLFPISSKGAEWSTTRMGDVKFTSLGATSLDVNGDNELSHADFVDYLTINKHSTTQTSSNNAR